MYFTNLTKFTFSVLYKANETPQCLKYWKTFKDIL